MHRPLHETLAISKLFSIFTYMEKEYMKDFETDLFFDRASKVIVFTHTDLDGAVAGIVARTVFPGARIERVNYAGSSDYANATRIISQGLDGFDWVLFSDFCPDAAMAGILEDAGLPYLVLDHHKTAVPVDSELGKYVIDQSKCGALLTLDYFSDIADMEYLRSLCVLTDDHDRWIRRFVPLSDDLNSVFYLHQFDEFMDLYKDGLYENGLHPDDITLLEGHKADVDRYLDSRETRDLPGDGIMLYDCREYLSDLNIILSEKFRWIVFAHETEPGITKLSFRTADKSLDLGGAVKSIGLGGGGHRGAAGQILPTDNVEDFVDRIAETCGLA